jgi:nitrous oxidase accessory protein NosD
MLRFPSSLTCLMRTHNPEGTRDRPAPAWWLRPLLIVGAGLAVLVAGSAVVPSAQAAAPCTVPSTAYPTIQAAVDETTCATIHVAEGVYRELITIARDVTIRGTGQDSTVIDGDRRGTVVTLTSGTVTIEGVTIRGFPLSGLGGAILGFQA